MDLLLADRTFDVLADQEYRRIQDLLFFLNVQGEPK